jgi:transcriptional regulator with XRE-family HTH domain
MSQISDNLRTILNELNMSQIDFAQSVGTTFVYINMVINGKRNSISRPLALLIEEKYGYSSEWILYNDGNKLLSPFLLDQKQYLELNRAIEQLSSNEINLVLEYIDYLEKGEADNLARKRLKKQKSVNSYLLAT